ncbi:MAG: malectin domain-containing carbohydrate-binding protein, partial [Leptolyngbyaceae bacterium]|nr:malectin domain-containing carbohydrate-binding protein [Leptolyngbyaceae bacterium]
ITELTGAVHAYTVAKNGVTGEYEVLGREELVLANGGGVVQSILNHNDDGSVNTAETNRLVTGMVVAGTASNPVLYLSSADPRRAFEEDTNLDTNSGVVTRVTRNAQGEWEAVDIVRGLPRSEESHSLNGLLLSADGTKLLLNIGSNTNNGGSSSQFAFTPEYALTAAVLEIDLTDIESRPILSDPNGGQNGTSRQYVYDLPTLDDPNIANDGVLEDANGMDVSGPWGGNDGLNQAILPADAPLRIYADGLRNNYDLVQTANGIYTVDNASNTNQGGNPVDANGNTTSLTSGEATNGIVQGGVGDDEPIFKLEDGGYFGHPNPTRANQNQSWTVYEADAFGNPIADPNLAVNFVADISALVPTGVNIAEGFLIDPSKFTADPDRLRLSGIRDQRRNNNDGNLGVQPIALLGQGFASTNGIIEYNSNGTAFDGALDGALIVTDLSGSVTVINLNADGTATEALIDPGVDGQLGTADDVELGSNGIYTFEQGPVNIASSLDITQGPDGTLWIASLFGSEILIYEPSDIVEGPDLDFDNDGIDNVSDPFIRDANNGRGVVLTANQTLLWDFDEDLDGNLPGPGGYAAGLTGHMVNGVDDYEQTLSFGNVKFVTASGGGTIIVENVAEGTPHTANNDGEYLFHTGLTIDPAVTSFTINWSVINPAGDIDTTFTQFGQEIGGYVGIGDQSTYLKIVATPDDPSGEVLVLLEENDVVVATSYIQADDLFSDAPQDGKIFFDLKIDKGAKTATPTVSYETTTGITSGSGLRSVTGAAIDLTGSQVLEAILGNYTAPGDSGATGLAVGLFSSNGDNATHAINGPENTFTAIFNDLRITADPALPTFSIEDVSVLENAGSVFVTVTLSEPLAVATSVNYQTTGYAELGGTLEFAAGETTQVIEIAIEDNEILDGDRSFFISLALGSNQTNVAIADGQAEVTIIDDEVAPNADLELSQTVSNDSPNVGDTITFTLTVSNAGTADATGVSVEDLLPNGFTYVSDSSGGTYNVATGIWDIGTVTGGGTATLEITATVEEAVEPTVLYRINAGGAELAATDGSSPVWSEDTRINPSPFRISGTNNTPSPSSDPIVFNPQLPIPAGVPEALFTTQRFDSPNGLDMQWEFPIEPGTEVEVRLYFAETFNNVDMVGERVFDVAIEGSVPAVFDDIDQFAVAGADGAFVLSHTLTVEDGILDIDFISGTLDPAVKGIEIVQVVSGAIASTDFTNYAQILTSDQADPDSTPGDNSVGDDDDASVTVTPVAAPEVSLSLSIDPTSISENGGIATATVTRTGDTSGALTVNLSSDDTSEATVPATVEIAAGQTSATFQLTGVDDADVDGTQTPTITASASGFTEATATLAVTDDDVAVMPELTLSIAPTSISENGGMATATVTRSGDTGSDLVVNLMSDDLSEATVPVTVTILAGQTSAAFAITSVDDAAVDGTQTPTITASATGYTSGSATLDITDDDVTQPEEQFTFNFSGASGQGSTFAYSATSNGQTLGVSVTASEEGIARNVNLDNRGLGVIGIDGTGEIDGEGGTKEAITLTFDRTVKLDVIEFRSA